MAKTINKQATIQKILDKANSSNGISIDTAKFNAEMQKPTALTFLKDACKFLSIQPIYVK